MNSKNKKKKRKITIFIIIASVITATFITSVLLILIKSHVIIKNNDFIFMGEYEDTFDGNYYYYGDEYEVLTNYYSYQKYFDSDTLAKEDFEDNNYVMIPIRYDSCSESEVEPTDYEINGNNITITVKYKGSCGLCAATYLYYLLKVDKNITHVYVDVQSIMVNSPHCDPYVVDKPIIYIYPTETTNVNVKLGYPEKLTVSYPKYENSWDVTAYPDGTLIDNKTGREHYGLYWEGSAHNTKVEKDGFIVKGEDITSFLEEKLSILGLTEKEADEFIIYWLPKLEQNKYNYIRFETMDEINSYMPLEITPSPDTLIRIVMDYKPLDEPLTVKTQELQHVERKGYTVVEWGGSLIEK